MADDSFGSNRGRDPFPRDSRARNESSDPLAELARLIGQGDPYDEGRARNPGYADEGGDPGLDWAAGEDYTDEREGPGARYAPPPLPAHALREQDYPPPPPADKFFSGPAAQFNGFGDDRNDDDIRAAPSTRQLPAFLSAPTDESSAGAEYGQQHTFRRQEDAHRQDYDNDPPYQDDDYYEQQQSPRRNTGLIVVMAVLGLAVIGTAGAFAYRAMFGGLVFGSSVFAGLPPIIKAPTSPIRIAPSNNAQADNSAPAPGGGSSTEKLVSREEQPMEPPKPAPRVVATIPVVGSQAAAPALANTTQAPAAPPMTPPPATTAEAPLPPAPQAQVPLPASPPASAPPAAASASPEPKKVRTVTIRANQSNNAQLNTPADASTQPAPTPAAPPRNSARPVSPTPKPSTAPTAGNAPLSIVPGAESETAVPAAVRARASAPVALASAEPTGTQTTNAVASGAAVASAGGYAVQVTSQHSEADAQASFKALQSKFPAQLSGRQPIIHRADLGAKGVYYRALVGPFASAEEAAGLCSSLKAAGGNCIVQRN